MKGRNIGMLLAGIWFVLTGLVPLLNIHVNHLHVIMALLALAAGILILLGR